MLDIDRFVTEYPYQLKMTDDKGMIFGCTYYGKTYLDLYKQFLAVLNQLLTSTDQDIVKQSVHVLYLNDLMASTLGLGRGIVGEFTIKYGNGPTTPYMVKLTKTDLGDLQYYIKPSIPAYAYIYDGFVTIHSIHKHGNGLLATIHSEGSNILHKNDVDYVFDFIKKVFYTVELKPEYTDEIRAKIINKENITIPKKYYNLDPNDSIYDVCAFMTFTQ